MINNFNFPEGVEWSFNYVSGPDFFSDDFKFSTAEKLLYYYSGYVVKYLDISNATSARNMFYNCINLISLPQLDTSNVTDMYNMFYGCRNLLSIPQLDTSKVTDMSYMFYNCTKLTTIPQLDTSNVTTMSNLFNGCNYLTTIPQLDISKVTSMYNIFYNCVHLVEVRFKGKPISTLNVNNMFSGIKTNGTLYYDSRYDYSKIINVLPSTWTAVPYDVLN